jgi:multidrug efflux pump subunit AcrA (membrane-fusion protein)
MKNKITLIIAILLIAAVTACSPKQEPPAQLAEEMISPSIIAEGHIVPADSLYLSFQTRGRVDTIKVEKGDVVKRGDILVSLADRANAEAAYQVANLEWVSALQAVDFLKRTAELKRVDAQKAFIAAQEARAKAAKEWEKFDLEGNEDDIIDAEADVVSYREDLKDAQEEFDKYASLDKDNSKRKNTADDLEKAQEDYNEYIRKLEKLINERDGLKAALDGSLAAEAEAKRTLENTMHGPDVDQLELANSRMAAAQSQVDAAQFNLDLFNLKAPFGGIIVDTNITEGEWIGSEKWAVLIADFSQWYVDTSDLSELDVTNITIGQTVTMTADALPDLTFQGTVEEISLVPENKGGDVLYKVRMLLIEPDPQLRWGMTIEVTFPVE